MNDFKIIAIEPLKGCNENYLKILTENKIYYFYNDYEINGDEIKYTPTVPNNFFNKKKLNINVSAIVGKNGTGKSSIVDILLMAINNIAFTFKLIKQIQTVELIPVSNLKVAIYYHTDNYYKVIIEDYKISIFRYDEIKKTIKLSKSDSFIIEYKEKSEGVYSIMDEKTKYNFGLEEFFYTIGINYSHYALNSKEYGDWVSKIFHKNDSYQAPLVVNPFRKKGNIDINSENHLLKSRLLAFLSKPYSKSDDTSYRDLTNRQTAFKAIFILDKKKVDYAYEKYISKDKKEDVDFDIFYTENPEDDIFDILYEVYGFSDIQKSQDITFKDEIKKYIVKKIISISVTYPYYKGYFDDEKGVFNKIKINNTVRKIDAGIHTYLTELEGEKSHVTFKLNQAINYLKYNVFEDFEEYVDPANSEKYIIPFDILADKISSIKNENEDTIEFIPPAIFDYDIELKNIKPDKDRSITKFSSLSSGEKQLIYSVYSILYHINNIDSISNKELTLYKNINLIFEEVELYFHPEMQKELLNYLLEHLNKQNFKNIKNVNLCFVTHSPFILSDIPSSNILFLNDKGLPLKKSEIKQTFGANIHDLLKWNFFMNDGAIGTFAKEQIQDIINILKDKESYNIDEILVIKQRINLIGEQFIKEKLLNMYYDRFDEFDKDARINELKLEIKKLEEPK